MLLHPLVLCSVILLGSPERGHVVYLPSPQESSVPERFRLKAETFWYELEPALATPRYTVSLLRFPSPITTPDVENNVVHAEFFDPVSFPGRRPAVVVLHILGSDFPLSRYMAARLADRGVAALFLKLPYYGERRPKVGPGPVVYPGQRETVFLAVQGYRLSRRNDWRLGLPPDAATLRVP